MKYYCLMFYILEFAPAYQKKTKDVTLPIDERVSLLKRQIAEQLKEEQFNSEPILPINSEHDEYSYVDIEKQPITPILNSDKRKLKDKFKLRELVTHPTKEATEFRGSTTSNPVKVSKKKRRHKSRVPKPLDSFYRRLLSDEKTPVQWIHCQDLITPYFNGYKDDMGVAKRLTIENHAVLTFLQLLNLNTTGHTKEEIYSILYQISNIQIRLFQWDVSAITSLLNVIIKDHRPHTFKNLIHGVRSLLSSWHLDFENTANLLKQSRIFRPPCIKISDYGGSTKTSKAIRYDKATLPTTKGKCKEPDALGNCKDDK